MKELAMLLGLRARKYLYGLTYRVDELSKILIHSLHMALLLELIDE